METLGRLLDRCLPEAGWFWKKSKQWIIASACKRIITEDDMQKQLPVLQCQSIEFEKTLNDNVAGMAVQQQEIQSKAWTD